MVVKLSPNNVNPKNSLLLSSHFDTRSVGPGGGDDGTMLSVMLEMLRVFVSSSQTFEHSIIFLFNNAEESGLHGSHMFITGHRWANDVKTAINLDSAGNGGKEVLFQISAEYSSWLLKYYKSSIPYPLTTTIAEDLFKSGLIPSDTDFRIYRDFGHVAGT